MAKTQTLIKIVTLSTILPFIALTSAVWAQFKETPLIVSGVVSLEIFPGPPNYESIKNGDAREQAWILTSAKGERFHLVILDDKVEKFATLRRCLGKKVHVKGLAWEALTGHHRTPFLITVNSIEAG
ncbi:MAG: DUF4431 domain-containing protein [Verrucomicrobiota bacterium]|nr:DUF4431 domain-containing protein [Verrucomicrobiota bacterium]